MAESRLPCLLSVVLLTLMFCESSFTKRVLLLTYPVGSHLMLANSIAEGLLSGGHEVSAIWNVRGMAKEDIMNPKVNLLRYDNGQIPPFVDPEYERALLSIELEGKTFSIFEDLRAKDVEECRVMLGNKALEDAIAKGNFDFVVLDAANQCLLIIAHRVNLPYAVFTVFLPPDLLHLGLQGPLLVRGLIDDMFSEEDRFYSKFLRVAIAFLYRAPEVYGEFSNKTLAELTNGITLWLYDVSRVLGTTLPMSPNVVHVGGLNTREPKPLNPGVLKTFVDSSKKGVILVSFGSYMYTSLIPDKMINIFIGTFRSLPYDFVWKLKKESLKPGQTLPSNVLAVGWIPQNDLLGHPNVKLFITHCGNSGQHEALYNRVPMLGIPFFGDQIFNAKRMESLHLGLYLRARDLSVEKLTAKIQHILTDSEVSKGLARASAIFRDQPMTPKATAAFWINHVMQHGADHLKSATYDMTWFEILMFDVLFVVVGILILLVAILCCTCRCVVKYCCPHSRSKVKTS